MIKIDNNEQYQVVELLGNKALFTTLRISSKNIPIGMFKYELRHEDDDGMTPCEVSYGIMVNHFGTILTNKHIGLQNNGCIFFDGNKDFNFLNEHLTVHSYKEMYRQQGIIKRKDRTR